MSAPDNQQQVSGGSVFWALTAIVVPAMLQPSFTECLWSGESSNVALSPYRSSPTICLIDAVVEIRIWIRRSGGRKAVNIDGDDKPSKVGTLTQICLFCLGVVPQAIKLFSMRGIRLTQLLAGAFLVSSLVSLLRSINVHDPEQELVSLVQRWKKPGPGPFRTLSLLTILLGWTPHLMGLYMILQGPFLDHVRLPVTTDFAKAFDTVSTAYLFGLSILFLQHSAFTMLGSTSPIPQYPVLWFIAMTRFGGLPALMQSYEEIKSASRRTLSIELLTGLAVWCYLSCLLLDYVTRHMRRWLIHRPSVQARDHNADLVRSHNGLSTTSTGATMATTRLPEDRGLCSEEDGDVGMQDLPPPCAEERSAAPAGPQLRTAGTTGDVELGCSVTAPDVMQRYSAPVSRTGTEEGSGASLECTESTGTNRAVDRPRWWRITSFVFGKMFHYVIFWPFALLFLAVILASGGFGLLKDDPEDQQQREVEQGGATDDEHRNDTVLPHKFGRLLNNLATFSKWCQRLFFTVLVEYVLLVVGRILLIGVKLGSSTSNWLEKKVTKDHPPRLLVTAFGLANFVVAAVYYLVCFDPQGTLAPNWSNLFGR